MEFQYYYGIPVLKWNYRKTCQIMSKIINHQEVMKKATFKTAPQSSQSKKMYHDIHNWFHLHKKKTKNVRLNPAIMEQNTLRLHPVDMTHITTFQYTET